METKKLNKHAQKWVDALKSGQYKQSYGCLTDDRTTFCCLGVACEVYNQEAKRLHKRQLEYCDGEYDGEASLPPDVVREWLNLKHIDGNYGDNSLVDLNDTGSTFKQIARVIESQPEGLFEK